MRPFKTRATIASLIGIVALVVSACGSTAKTTTKGVGYDYSYTYAKPTKTGGTVVFGDWQAPDSANLFSAVLDPTVVNNEVFAALWDGCFVQLPDLSLALNGFKASQCTEVPTVANGDVSSDGQTVTLKLDPKAKWSDGQPVVADDYMMYYNMYVDPNVGGFGSGAPWNKATVTEVDDHTVKIDWGTPFAPYLFYIPGALPSHQFPKVFSNGKYDTDAAQAIISDETFLNSPVTNGPYKVESFSPDAVVMVPNTNYYSNYFHQSVLDKLIFRQAGTKDVLIQAFKAGQYDHVEDFTPADNPKFNGIDPAEVISSQAYLYEHLEFNQRDTAPNAANTSDKKSIFTDINIRKAFIGAFNKCTAIQAVLGVNCTDPAYFTNEINVGIDPTFNAAAEYPKYDPASSAKVLDDAGYKVDENGIRTYPGTTTEVNVKISTTFGNSVRNSWIALMQQQWQGNLQIAVTLDPNKKIFSGFDDGGLLATGNFDVALFAFNTSTDADSLTTIIQSDQVPGASFKGGQNYSGVVDTKIDDALAKGRVDLNYTDRISVYKDLQTYISAQAYFAPLYIRPNVSLTKTTLGNYKQHPALAGNTWNAGDWYQLGTSS